MKSKIAIIIASTATLLLSGCGSEIVVKKEHPPVAPEWVTKNNDEVNRTIFQVNKTALPALNNYLDEREGLFQLKYIDFEKLPSLDPTKLALAYTGKEANLIQDKYVELINSVKKITDIKIAERQQAITKSKAVSQDYVMKIEALELNREGYRRDVQAVYDLKEQTIEAQKVSKQAVKDYSAQLSAVLNQHESIDKSLKSRYFERPKMKEGSCSEAVISESRSIEVAYTVQGFCFSSRFKVERDTADALLNDSQVMSELESKITAIALEKIKQGDTYKKEGGKPGYSQQIRAFSYGGIQDVKSAAKKQYGGTEKGLTYDIKSLNKRLASNNRKIETQIKNVSNISKRDIIHSAEMKALTPVAEQLDALIAKYLDASIVQIIGKPIKQSTEDYHLISLDESEGVLLVEDTYPSGSKKQVELYLINPTILQTSEKIKKNFDGEEIPARAAARVDALRHWKGDEAYYARSAPSLASFLSNL